MPEVLNKDKLLEQAKAYADQGKLDRAVQEYSKILQMDPKDLRLKLRLAELYVKQKKMAEAIQTYQDVATSYTDDAFYLKAVTVYKNILRLNPSLLDVNRKLAELYEKMGLVTDAIHQYQIVANMLEQKSMDDDLLLVRKQIVTIAPEVPVHRIRLAEAYQICGKENDALNEYEILVQQLMDHGTPEQLIELYEKILAHRPDNVEMVRNLCVVYEKVGDWKKSLKRMEVSEALVLQDTELLEKMAEFYARQNQMATAADKLKDLSELFIAKGDVDNAIRVLAASVVYAPEEEDTVRQEVEALKEGAAELLTKMMEARRSELQRREEEETIEAETRAAAEAAKATQPAQSPQTGKAPATGKMSPPPAPVPAAAPKVDVSAKRREAENAEALAATYENMGLSDEAKGEWRRAEAAYAICIQTLPEDTVLKTKLDAVQKKLNPEVPKVSAPVVAAPVPPKPSSRLASPTKPVKKRISFV